MLLINIIVTLIVIGVLLYCVNRFIPLDPKIRQILNAVVVIVVVLWLLGVFLGGLGWLETIRVGPVRH